MKLLKIISFFFIVYFLRRFFQMYKELKRMQEAQPHRELKKANTVDADYKVLD